MCEKIFLYVFCFITISIFCQCKKRVSIEYHHATKNNNTITINIDDIKEEEYISFSSIFQDYEIIPLETKQECLIGEISQMELYNDTIYILDSQFSKSLFQFDINGKFIRKFGDNGKGIGEFIVPNYFSVNKKKGQISILDTNQKKIITFSTNGIYLFEQKIADISLPIQIASMNEFTYIDQLISRYSVSDNLLTCINNTLKNSFKMFPNQEYTHGFNQPSNVSFNFFTTNKNIKYTKPFFDTIFCISNDKVEPFLTVSTDNKITSDEIAKMNSFDDLIAYQQYKMKCNKFFGITSYIESNSILMFRYKNKRVTHELFYWPKDKQVHCTNLLIDDLTYQTEHIAKFVTADSNYFISIIQNDFPEKIDEFIENIRNKKIELSNEEKESLKSFNANSNPVVILYECRDKFIKSN